MKVNPNQKLHVKDGQLFTTLHDRPEWFVADVADDVDGPELNALVEEICRRFNNFDEPMPTRWIERAAIMYEGVCYHLPSPYRHHDVIRDIARQNGVGIRGGDVQGFLDNRGTFVNREEALAIALAARQVLDIKNIRAGELFSEDLW